MSAEEKANAKQERAAKAAATLEAMQHEPYVDINVAAAALGVPPGYLYERTRPNGPRGTVPHVKLGKYVRFKLSELEAWARANGNGNHA